VLVSERVYRGLAERCGAISSRFTQICTIERSHALGLDLDAQGPPSLIEVATEGAENMIEHVAENVVEEKVEDAKEKVTSTVGRAVHVTEDAVEGAVEQVVDRFRNGDDD
jgi:hypothetical protein